MSESQSQNLNNIITGTDEAGGDDIGSSAQQKNKTIKGLSSGNVRINTKVQLLSLTVVIITLLMTAGISAYNAYNTALNSFYENAERLTQQRSIVVNKYLKALDDDIYIISDNGMIRTAIKEFETAKQFYTDVTAELQSTYIDNNPHSVGEKDKLVATGDGSYYDDVHSEYHSWFNDFKQRRGYYDVFLIDLEGDVIYSVSKESDFATNLIDGEWQDAGLGRAYREAIDNIDSGDVAYDDWEVYGPTNGLPAAFLARIIYEVDGEPLGVLAVQMPQEEIQNLIGDKRTLPKGQSAFLVNKNLQYLTDPPIYSHDVHDHEPHDITILQSKVPLNDSLQKFIEGADRKGFLAKTVGHNGQEVSQHFVAFPFHGVTHALIIETNRSVALKQAYDAIKVILVVAFIVILVMFFATKYVAHTISRPIISLTNAMRRLVDGDKSIEFGEIKGKNEISQMIRAVAVFKEGMLKNEKLSAEKDVYDEIERQRVVEMKHIAEEFHQNVQGLLESASAATVDIQDANSNVTDAAKETVEFSQDISRITQEATDDVQMVASATAEMSSSINEINTQMRSSLVTVGKASTAVKDTDKIVNSMSKLSDQIVDIVSLINDIAGQTNLLALNATIEAARAGEAGKGFAVVANEVKNLASQTTKATEDISAQITAVRDIANQSVQSMNIVNEEIRDISDMITLVTTSVEQQSATTAGISQSSTSASTKTTDVSQKVNAVLEHAEGTLAQSEVMAASVNRNSQTFKEVAGAVATFLTKLDKI